MLGFAAASMARSALLQCVNDMIVKVANDEIGH